MNRDWTELAEAAAARPLLDDDERARIVDAGRRVGRIARVQHDREQRAFEWTVAFFAGLAEGYTEETDR